ncbi:MAG: right-handed parallel beta-helix repeat-containing protein [Planctomycetota bacterium]|nr:MAG: right-handed parallel beta-helix repeat-containing protein [Planctomycetota bacterium]
MKKASLISFAVFFIITGQASGDWTPWYWPPTDNIQILPENPTSSDVVVITLSGDWPDSCIPNGSSVSVTGNDIYFDVIYDYPPDIICLTVITPWQQTQSVGPLSPGIYTVYARIVGDPYIPETYTPLTEFIVTDYRFVLSTESITVPEGGTTTFTVALLNPLGTVEVTVANESGDPDITVESGALLTFDSSNYSEPQTVIVSAEEDEDYLDGATVILVSAPEYLTTEVTATEADNDTPSVLYVDVNAIGSNNGTNWSDAYTDLQDALSIAAAYPEVQEIRVAQGVYTPAEPNGNRSASFNLTNIRITGGYAGFGESDLNVRDMSLYKTTLSGDLNGDDGLNFANNGENSHTVAHCDGTVALDGLTISGGNAFGGRGAGAGLYNHSGCQLTATNCIFSRNIAMYGGGMYNNSGNITLVNCIFFGNSATGGGIYSNPCNLTLINCTVSNNSGRGMTGSRWYTYVTLTNCIFWSNGGTSESDQIGSGQFTTNYSCIQGLTGSLGGIANIDADPCFVGPDDGDYRLSAFSPCIDAGDPNYLPQPNETDLDGKPRVLDGNEDGTAVVDMGAYEFGSLPPIEAVVKVRPRTLNLRSRGKWITCHISLPEDYNVADIEPDSIFLEDEIEADKVWVDEDQQVIMSKFSRSALQELLADLETPTTVELFVSGQLSDGTLFEGTDVIKVLNKARRQNRHAHR